MGGETGGDVKARTVLVTGCTRGCGRAMVDRLVEQGHTVIGCGRSREETASLQQRFGEPHEFAALDVADAAAVSRWATALLARREAPDLLVNNAAIINRTAPLWQVAAEEFDRVMSVNVGGTANVLRAFLPSMIARGRGVVINISSGWGREADPEVVPYCASKFAVEGLRRGSRRNCHRGSPWWR